MNIGLVLEGGAMRGIYTAGVLDAFLDNDIHFPAVMGVSAGALHGCSYVSEQRGRSIRYYKKYRNDPRFMSLQSLVKTGDVVGKKFCYEDIPERLDPFDYETFARSDTDFYAVCTNVETGKAEYILISDMLEQMDVMRASASMPFVSRMVHYDGKKLLDGGVADSIPVLKMREMGFDKVVVVLTQDVTYRKKETKIPAAKIRYHKYPEFAKAMDTRYLMYNQTLDEIAKLEEAGDIFVIRPSKKMAVKRMETDMTVIEAAYNLGVKDAEARLPELLKWMRIK